MKRFIDYSKEARGSLEWSVMGFDNQLQSKTNAIENMLNDLATKIEELEKVNSK